MKNSWLRISFLLLTLVMLLPLRATELADRPLDIVVNFPPPFPREFTAYFNNPTAYTITVTNFSNQDQEVFFLAEMKGLMNNVLVRTADNFRSAESIIIPANGTVMLTGDDVANLNENIGLDDLITTGIDPGDLNINGMLPEGMYQFCINAYDFNLEQNQPLSVGCGTLIDIFYGDQVAILQPLENEIIPDNPGSVFTMQWDPNITDAMKRMDLEYNVRMIDLTEHPDADLDILLRDGAPQGIFDETLLPIMEEIYLYNSLGTDIELEMEHQYAMRVQAIDPDGEILFPNDGYSEVRTFFYGGIPPIEDDNAADDEEDPLPECVTNCEFTDDLDTTPGTNVGTLTELQIGNFTIEDVDFTGSTSGPIYSGTGTIRLDWLGNFPLAVTLSQVRVNAAGRVYAGSVKARDDSNTAYDLGDLDQRLDAIADYVPDNAVSTAINQHVTSLRMLETLVTGEPTGVPVGLDEELQGHKFTIAIVSATFTPREADVNLMAFVDLTSLNPYFLLPLAAKDVCLTPQGFGSEALMHLTQNYAAPPMGGMELSLTGANQSETAIRENSCYVEFDCDGLKELAVRGKVGFPRNTMVPDDDGAIVDTGKVHAYFEFTLDRNVPIEESAYAYRADPDDPVEPEGTHLMMGLTMDPFQINGLEGWSFHTLDATLDLSDLENPESIIFPADYAASAAVDTGLLWQGFHLKAIEVLTPATMRGDSQRTAMGLYDLIIDPEPSISVNARATNVIDVQSGNLEGWGFSLDTFRLDIVQNTLTSGRLVGKVSTPLMGSAEYLRYKAIINQNDDEQYEFNAIATPDSLISLPMVIAEAALCPNSFIQFKLKKDTTMLTTFLAGQMTVDVTNNLPESLQDMNLLPELSIRLADFQLNYNTEDGFVTEGPNASTFGFGLEMQTDLCGAAYSGPVFVDTDQPDYDYDIGDMEDLLQNGIQPDPGSDEANSNQESVSGFPISIDDYQIDFTEGSLDLRLTIGVHLSNAENNGISGSATIGARSTVKVNGIKIKKVSLDSLWLECVYVGTKDNPLDFDFMTIWGGVCFRDYNGGKGFEGEVHLGIGDNMSLDLAAGFGKYGTRDDGDFGTEDYYGWWYIDGMFRMDPGITVGPVTFNGFGGAIYWNVAAPDLTLSIDEVMAMSDGGAPAPPIDPFPSYGQRNLAFRASLSIVNPKVVVVDPEIAVSWHVEDGLQAITLNGGFWVAATDYSTRAENARLWGNTSTGLSFEYGTDGKKRVAVVGTNSIYANIIPNLLFGAGPDMLLVSSAFAMGSETLFDYPELDHSDPDDVYWFFNCGNPYEGNMGGIKFELPGFDLDDADNDGSSLGASASASVEFYLMTGQNVPSVLPDPPGRIEELFAIIDNHASGSDGNSGGTEPADREDDRDSDAAQTGGGLVMGAHVMASAEINAVVYARLAILAGMDMMLFQYPPGTTCITEGGQLIEDIGMNGWYGTGRAYVGMEGVIGAKGKILGKEIDVKIMHLVAAVMLEAGGPKPMYLDGRVGIYYNLLNGFIEGSARMKIAVGDKCQPIGGSPFGFPVIVETNPAEGITDDVTPFIRPKVSFSIPLADDPDDPAYDRIMRLTDTEDRVIERIAYIHEFSITPVGGAARADYSRDPNYPLLVDEGRAAQYRPRAFISGIYGATGHRNWRMNVVIRAREKLSNGSWVDIPGENGRGVFEESRTIDFRTDPLPDELPNSMVGISKPLRNQHFFLQNDIGYRRAYIKARQQLSGTYFATELSGRPQSYKGLVIDAATGEEISRTNVNYSSTSRTAIFNLPVLDNDKEYELAIIRRDETLLQVGSISLIQRELVREDVLANYADQDVSSEYAVNADVVDLNTGIDLSYNETLIFKWNFRTSRHNTLNEKMADANISAFPQAGYQTLTIRDFEGFDNYDIYGKTKEFDTNTEDEEQFKARPLVQIADPMSSDFFNDLAKPMVGDFSELYHDDYAQEPTGLYALLNTSGIPGSNGDAYEQDLEWPHTIFMEVPLNSYNTVGTNFAWHESMPALDLQEFIRASDLLDNTANALAQAPWGNRSIQLTYYVTEHVMEDAGLTVDFYEYWRDRIMNPEDHVDNVYAIGEAVNVHPPDTRVDDLAPLDLKYLALVNSDLILDPPATILTVQDIDEANNPPPPPSGNNFIAGGLTTTTTVTGLFGGGGNQTLTATPGTAYFAGSTTNATASGTATTSGIFYEGSPTYQVDWEWPSLFGFSSSLRFRANRSFDMTTNLGSSRVVNFNN